VADFDFASLVYPKIIKVVCPTEPTYAEVVTDGEVTEIKSQSKEVEITANGVTEIAPDAGFGYLSGVKVNVNVQGGGAGGDAPSGGGMKYYNAPTDSDSLAAAIQLSMMMKADFGGMIMISTSGILAEMKVSEISSFKAFAVDTTQKMSSEIMGGVGLMPLSDIVSSLGLTEITEEEFYNLEA
jgi:hypothetical protein